MCRHVWDEVKLINAVPGLVHTNALISSVSKCTFVKVPEMLIIIQNSNC